MTDPRPASERAAELRVVAAAERLVIARQAFESSGGDADYEAEQAAAHALAGAVKALRRKQVKPATRRALNA